MHCLSFRKARLAKRPRYSKCKSAAEAPTNQMRSLPHVTNISPILCCAVAYSPMGASNPTESYDIRRLLYSKHRAQNRYLGHFTGDCNPDFWSISRGLMPRSLQSLIHSKMSKSHVSTPHCNIFLDI